LNLTLLCMVSQFYCIAALNASLAVFLSEQSHR
jgi:hypothetical protein